MSSTEQRVENIEGEVPPIPTVVMHKPAYRDTIYKPAHLSCYIWNRVINEMEGGGSIGWDAEKSELILHYRLSGIDWDMCPTLGGVEEIWLAIRMATEDVR